MIQLKTVTPQNWQALSALTVRPEQAAFLDSPLGILARGYVYRGSGARVLAIFSDRQPVGLALVKELDEEPACYDLQQFLIDRRFQRKGFGARALALILERLAREGKYPQAEVCVHRDNAAALGLFEKAGFSDAGYVDPAAPHCRNLVFPLENRPAGFSDALISDFTDPLFQAAFRQYFAELGIQVRDWDGLFREMNSDGGNAAFVRTTGSGQTVGFLQFKPTTFTSWFFEETCGFVREFWIAPDFRSGGHGTVLLRLTEEHFRQNGIFTSILTTDTAPDFYRRLGYLPAPGCAAKNGLPVFVKRLS